MEEGCQSVNNNVHIHTYIYWGVHAYHVPESNLYLTVSTQENLWSEKEKENCMIECVVGSKIMFSIFAVVNKFTLTSSVCFVHSCHPSHPKTYLAVIMGVKPEATATVKTQDIRSKFDLFALSHICSHLPSAVNLLVSERVYCFSAQILRSGFENTFLAH